jgi:SAM-dependent methyltransferase
VEFNAHNIELANGDQTRPGTRLLRVTSQSHAILRTMRLAFAGRNSATVRVADLGCLEGGYAVELARAGYDTVGLEGREENYACCEYVADRIPLPNLQFVCDDVRNLPDYGAFDAVLCIGLLYHLDEPTSFLELLGRCTRRLLIVQTHYASDRTPDGARLGRWTTHEGRRGRWCEEVAAGASDVELLADRWASVGNRESFWLDKYELIQVMREAGFDLTFEQYDFVDSVLTDDYIERYSRSMFVGIRTADLDH